ncbi:MAG: acetolactate decarboxylase [Desulfovibrionaceae bacterium]
MFLTAPVGALVEGLFEQPFPLGELAAHGDLGIGTFNDLDGEMILVDGRFWRADAQGRVTEMPPETRTPFAAATWFNPDTVDEVDERDGTDAFALLDALLPSPNMLYALRVDGEFELVRARSVPRQPAGRPLVEATRSQAEFEFPRVTGSLVGFFTPAYLGGAAVPGLHLHFVDQPRTRGGHALAARLTRGAVRIQHVPQLRLALPVTLDFLTLDLAREDARDVARDLDEAER